MEREKQIRSSEVQDILTRVPHWILIWSNSIILLLIIGFFAATWFIKYPDIISGETKITSINPIYKAIANKTGRLDSILVANNENVKRGQILAIIKNNASLDDILRLKNMLDTISLREDNLSLPSNFFSTLSLGELNTSFALFENEFLDFRLRNSFQYYSHSNSHQLSMPLIAQRLQLSKEQRLLEYQSLTLAKKDLKRDKELYNEGVIPEKEYETKKMDLQNREKNLKSLDISITQLNQSMIESKRASQETNILRELEKSKLYKNTIHALTKLKEDIKSWEEQYLIKSEIDGSASMAGVWNQDQIITQGDHIFSIIPKNAGGFIARLKAPEVNSGKIKVGQHVNIKLNNYPETEYGFISGYVSSISSLPSSEGFYWIEISLPDTLLSSYNIEIPYQLEMSGTAEVITEDLRLFERFFYRLRGIIS